VGLTSNNSLQRTFDPLRIFAAAKTVIASNAAELRRWAPVVLRSQIIEKVCSELQEKHSAHTILLYGSEADGTSRAESDLDIAAFAAISEVIRDARLLHGTYIDVFVYPEIVLSSPSEEHLRFRGSRVLKQQGASADTFLSKLDAFYNAGLKPLAADELSARREWAGKMLGRLARGDIEGHFRRSWLLTALLEDCFHLRGNWYEGPKKSFQWLQQNDPDTHRAFDAALTPGAEVSKIKALMVRVVGQNADT